MKKINWNEALQPLLKKYKGKKHPLDYKSLYQLVVMVILSAQDSDKHINEVAKPLFEAFPDMPSLAKGDADMLFQYIRTVRNFGNKMKWVIELSQKLQEDKNIPLTMDGLTALPGIGRKSANVILREARKKAEGIIVDLHVLRVTPRLGIATGTDAKKVEKKLMEIIDPEYWGEIGMAISFLGRETCRPASPKCTECVVNKECAFPGKIQ